MLGLPSELLGRCRDVLLQCNELASDALLRAVFVSNELYPFRNRLPEVASKVERVDTCLDYLLGRCLSDGRPVLPLFLAVLRDRYQSGDALHDDLEALVKETRSALAAPSTPMPTGRLSKISHPRAIMQLDVSDLHIRALYEHDESFTFGAPRAFGSLRSDQFVGVGQHPRALAQPSLFLAHAAEEVLTLAEIIRNLPPLAKPTLWGKADFVGRERLIEQLIVVLDTARMIIILGIPGVGKTALMAQLAARFDSDKVFGYRFRLGLISVAGVLMDLARFLDSQPASAGVLAEVIQVLRLSENAAIDLLIEELNKGCYYLFFDEIHHITDCSGLNAFFALLMEGLQQGAAFVAGRSKPGFYTILDEGKGLVKEIELDGLHEHEIVEFFDRKNLPLTPELAQALDTPLGALPMALELMVPLLSGTCTEVELAAIASQAAEQVVDYLFTQVYEQLSPAEREMLTTASLLFFPFSRDELLDAHQVIFGRGGSQSSFLKLRNQLLIQQFTTDLYQVHENIGALALAHGKQINERRVQLADHLTVQAPDLFERQLEVILLYLQAGAFDQAANKVLSIVDMGLLEYDLDLAETLLDGFQEGMVGPQQWVWLLGSRGSLARLRRHYEEAEKQYRAMLQLAEKLEDKEAAAIVLQRLGILYFDRDDAMAESYYQDSLTLKREMDDREGQAQIYNNLGLLYTKQDRYAEAQLALEEGLKLLEAIGAPEYRKLSLYSNLAYLHAEQKQWQDANQLTEKARRIAEEMGSPCDVAKLTYNLGIHEAWQGNMEGAREHHLEALRIAQSHGCWEIEELAQIALGRQNDESGNYNEAIACFREAADIRQRLGDQSGLASITFDIGTFYWHKGDTENALGYYESGIALFEHLADDEQVRLFLHNIYGLAAQSGEPRRLLQPLKCLKERLKAEPPSYSLAEVYGMIGQIYLSLLDRERVGLACLRQQTALLDQLDRKRELTGALAELGAVCGDLRLYGEALHASTQAIEIADSLGLSHQAAQAYYSRANCFANLEMWQQAEDDYRRSLELADKSADAHIPESARHNLGEVYRRQGRSQEAIELLLPSLAYARKQDDVEDEIKTLNNLGLAYQAMAQDEKALAHFHEALELCKQHDLKRDESNVLISLGNLCLQHQDPEQAKNCYEQAMVAARAAKDSYMEEGSIISLAHAHRQLGTFEVIADDFKTVAERAGDLQHYDNLLQLLTLAGEIDFEEGEMEAAAEMFEQALIVAAWIGYDSLQRLAPHFEDHAHFSELLTLVARICALIDQALQDNSVEQAQALYDSMTYTLQHSEYWDGEVSWLFGLVKPIGHYLTKRPRKSAWEYVTGVWAQKGI